MRYARKNYKENPAGHGASFQGVLFLFVSNCLAFCTLCLGICWNDHWVSPEGQRVSFPKRLGCYSFQMKRQPREMKTICAPGPTLNFDPRAWLRRLGSPLSHFTVPGLIYCVGKGRARPYSTADGGARRASTRLARAQRSDSVRKLINSVSVHCRTGTLSTGRSFFLLLLCSARQQPMVHSVSCLRQ